MQEQILAALKKLGPSSPGAIADHLGTEGGSLSYHLKALLDAGTIKAAGRSKARRIALPDQELDATATEAPTPSRKKKHGKKAKHAKKTKHAKPAPRAAAPGERFIASVDAQRRLVILNGSGEPIFFTDDQTEAIATVLFIHYDKA